MRLSDFFETVYCPLRLIGRSPRTKTLFRYTIRLFSQHLGRPATLDDLQDLVVARYLATLIDDGRKPAGVNKERRQLVALWNLAAKKRLVDQFPTLPTVHEPEQMPNAWTFAELLQIQEACRHQPGTYHGVAASDWWLAMQAVLWSTGERINAVMQARWRDVSGNIIVFPANHRKGSRKSHVCQLTPAAVDALERIRQPQRELIFPWPYTETYIYRVYTQILKRANLEHDARSKFHRMRRTHATHLKAAGGDPTASLGHANPATTARYIDQRMIPNAVAQLLSKQERLPFSPN